MIDGVRAFSVQGEVTESTSAVGRRILHVLPTDDEAHGGPLHVARNLIAETNRSATLHAMLLAGNQGGARRRVAYWPGVGWFRRCAESVRNGGIVHVHGLWTAPTSGAAFIALRERVPYVVSAHGMLRPNALLQSRARKRAYLALLERRLINGSAALHLFDDREVAVARGLGLTCSVVVLPNGAPMPHVPRQPAREDRRITVLTLGRVERRKGFDVLIPAFARASRLEPRLHLVVAGPDEDGHLKQVLASAQRYGVGRAITYTGPVGEPAKAELFRRADVFVHPSETEGDSLAVKEAMAAGLPVVLSAPQMIAGFSEADAGRVVPRRAQAISDAIIELCRIGVTGRAAMGERARKLVRERYTWERIATDWASVYDDILSKRRAHTAWRT
jgi:glycosyltransferase involved in cell wall biosynthesis